MSKGLSAAPTAARSAGRAFQPADAVADLGRPLEFLGLDRLFEFPLETFQRRDRPGLLDMLHQLAQGAERTIAFELEGGILEFLEGLDGAG